MSEMLMPGLEAQSSYKDLSFLSFQYCNGGDLAEYLQCKLASRA